ncbi:MAG: hypothetical protein IT446_14085 [Phycisphaerales bacterium]|jgi:hypothetical protein|nr:hypothetical protein [Phycisphaerales bacterium]
MDYLSPITGSILQGPTASQQQSADKTSQLRRQRRMQRNIAVQDEQLEYQVESAEELSAIREERNSDHPHHRPPTHQPTSDDSDEPHIDLTA